MGVVAVISGTIYALLHFFWLRKLRYDKVDEEVTVGKPLQTDIGIPCFVSPLDELFFIQTVHPSAVIRSDII